MRRVTVKKQLARKTRQKQSHIFFRLQLFFVPMLLILFGTYFLSGIGMKLTALKSEAVETVKNTTKEYFSTGNDTFIFSSNGEVVSNLSGEKKMYYLTFDQIPQSVKDIFVSTEDKRFFNHNGIDFKAIVRAFTTILEDQALSEGGSTITQQLSRNLFLSFEKTWQRKVKEIFIAMEIEKIYSKEEILEFYINNIYFANSFYGIQAASKGYLGKDVSNLNLSETVFLCAIPNNPSLYNPLKNFDNTLKRRDRILDILLKDQIITEEEYTEAVNTKIIIRQTKSENKIHNYIETYAQNCAVRALMEASGFKFQYKFDSDAAEKEYDEAYAKSYSECQEKLKTGGYKVYTSIDLNKQEELQSQIDNSLAGFTDTNEEGTYLLQSAAVCINNQTGFVEAIVGGRTQDGYTLNRAYQSFRQPGSTIKPILVYTPALERGYTPDTVVTDKPIKNGPKNADGKYSGNMSLRKAVALSKNTIAWNLLAELTPEAATQYLYNMHFTHLAQTDNTLPIALGGFTYGVSAVEMAGAYSALVNNGTYKEPTCVMKITDSFGQLIWERTEETQIYAPEATDAMIDMLGTVMTSGTGAGYALKSMPCAGKTGTTNDNKDSWFAGITHYYTTIVWTAYDTPATLPSSAVKAPIKVWKNFNEQIHKDLPYATFR